MDIATTTDTHKNNRLDAIGQKIVFGENPYHTTDAYKENIAKRIAQIFEEAGNDLGTQSADTILHTYDKPATKEEWESIVRSIEEDCVLSLDPEDLTMFKYDVLAAGIREGITMIGNSRYPIFLSLGGAEKITKKEQGGWQSTLGDIELHLEQYNNEIAPKLSQDEIQNINTYPYRIFMKIRYAGEDASETLPSENNSTRQGRKKYDISFVVLEDTNKTPGKTLIQQGLHVNKKEMDKEVFLQWFSEQKNNIIIHQSIDKNNK